MIINKPPGVSVHNEEGSVIDHFKKSGIDISAAHRIDKETSGLLLLSKKNSFTSTLQTALQDAQKTYTAVCRAQMNEEQGQWRNSLSEKAQGRKNPAGIKSLLKKAITHWSCLKKNNYFSLLELRIETGRTHQIRRHAVLNKHAVIGDSRYGEKKYNDKIASSYDFKRMALHASNLKISIEGEDFNFDCAIPATFLNLVAE
ncbi:hypothetical protein A9Q84_10330 [Halobacteriovorax marinus]|uniref:Pseudouridine synthase RsuA/RluA-like domain-containing protein n=1 Tax=Halobacteriovorax marinus TaxID=97084 RepID=A0A1Y5FCQ8_9BACT|nr:hypothetical protein A9Q84_10330 [Halobacteriovorax marinus]